MFKNMVWKWFGNVCFKLSQPTGIIHELFIDFTKHVVVQPPIYAVDVKMKEMLNYSNKYLWWLSIGGYYSTLIRPGLRVIGLNTNLLYSQNKLTGKSADPAQQFQWMTTKLIDARKNNEKVTPFTQFICLSEGVSMMPVPQSPKQSWEKYSWSEELDHSYSSNNDCFIFIQTWNQEWNLKLNKTLSMIVIYSYHEVVPMEW